MRGLSKRKGSDVWQGKFRIPQRLWARREELRALGVEVGGSQEFTLSLRVYEAAKAAVVYRAKSTAWETTLGAWEAALREGPQALSTKQRVALAGQYAKAFLALHEEEPFDAPPPPVIPEPGEETGPAAASVVEGMSVEEKRSLRSDLKAFLQAEPPETPRYHAILLARHPALGRFLAPALAEALEEMHGADTDVALATEGLRVDAATRRLLNLEMARLLGAVERGLEARRGGAYVPVLELEAVPPFIRGVAASGPPKVATFQAIISAQAAKRKAGQGARPMPERSVQKYRRIADAFAEFRHSDDATTATARQVEEWADSLLGAGKLSNRTVADHLVALGTVINWGKRQREHREAMARAETISGRVELPRYQEKPGDVSSYTLEEARMVLAAARLESDPRKRWLPWLCLYAGLRISEAESLRKADFFLAEGRWFLKVTSAGKRSLKTASSERRVPVHPALEAEGFLEWVSRAGEGRLFASGATSLLGRWVKSPSVGLTRPGIAPNHGLRHLFVGLCRRYGVEGSAAEYLAGHSTPAVHAKYGSSEVMLPGLAAELRKIEPVLALPQT